MLDIYDTLFIVSSLLVLMLAINGFHWGIAVQLGTRIKYLNIKKCPFKFAAPESICCYVEPGIGVCVSCLA